MKKTTLARLLALLLVAIMAMSALAACGGSGSGDGGDETKENLERTANIVEDLNFYSNLILKPAWYEQLLQRRYVRDNESEESLDLILAGRIYDVGMMYDFGGIVGLLGADVRTSNISTQYARLKKAIDADIKATYRDFGLV